MATKVDAELAGIDGSRMIAELERRYLEVSEAAAKYDIDDRALRALCRDGKIRTLKLFRRTFLIEKVSIAEYFKAKQESAQRAQLLEQDIMRLRTELDKEKTLAR